MAGYTPPFIITNKALRLVATISEKTEKVVSCGALDVRPRLRRNNRIRSIHASLRIEANSLSLSEVRDVIDGRAVIADRIEIQEVKNAFRAYDQLQEIDPYNLQDLKRIHGVMTAGVIAESGSFRKGKEGVFSGDQCVFIAPPARNVPGLMAELFSWMKANRAEIHPLILSAVFHYEFVFIHPFSDGNGRMARLWHSALLAQWRPVYESIPLENQIEKFQDGYYEAISASNRSGDSTGFVEFMLERIDQALDEALDQLRIARAETSAYIGKLVNVMAYGVSYSAIELMTLLGLRSRETFRKHYLTPAMDQGLVAMTVPEKPNSRNQRYIRT